MTLLLPLLAAACSGGDGESAAAPQLGALEATQLDTAVAAQGVAHPAGSVAALSDFDVWARRLMADRASPVVAQAGDMSQVWVGADDRVASVVVRGPRTAGKVTVTIAPPASGADATPVFQAAIAQLKRAGGGTLKVAPGDYRFKTANSEQPGLAHILLSRLSDVDIQAAGANLTFEGNLDGILIQDCQRLRIFGARIRDARVLSGTGRIRTVGGVPTLQLDQPLPAGVAINWVQAMNEGTMTWPQAQSRTIIAPTMAQPARVDDKTFTSPEFRSIKDGQYVAVKFTYYATRGIYVRDSYTQSSEDLTFDGISIGSVGGIGLLVKSRGRGLALQNSTIKADAGRPYSTNYDGVHVIAFGGDILLRGNKIMNTGDDPINLRSIIHKVTPTGSDSATLTNDARLIRIDDEVAFFNKDGEYLGKRIVGSAPPVGNSDTITFGFKPGEPFTEATYARVINFTPRRFAVVNNTLADAPGRGMLIQIPNGLIQNNTISRFPRTAIRLLTSFDPWLEGAGAINVRIANNTIVEGGAETGLRYATGIITAVAEVISTRLPTNMHNGPLRIENNKFVAPRTNCIAVYNTKGIVQANNSCG